MSGPGPLAGILVADLSRVVAGPYAAMLLGDLGADVVKVERPGRGDDSRGFGPPFVSFGDERGPMSSYYLSVNRNKRSVAWDLSSEEGRAKALALATRADVVIENFKPGGAAKLGLSYEEVSGPNPRVVYCSVSGFGQRGEGASLPGYDFIAQATAGLMSITGDGGAGGARKVGVAVVDVLTALFASNAILAAIVERESSGRGQHVEVDLFSTCLAALINQASAYITAGSVPVAMGNRHPSIAPYETLRAADRELVVAVGNDTQFAAMVTALGKAWMSSDERFSSNAARVVNREEMVGELEEALGSQRADQWAASLQAAGVPSGVVNDVPGAFALADRLGLGPVVRVAEKGSEPWQPSVADPFAQVASPMGLSRTPVSYRLAPPFLGEHSEEVEAELGEAVEPGGVRAGGRPTRSS